MIVLIILGFIVIAAGIIGCVLPIIPGPPLCYAALILLSFARKWQAFSPAVLIVLGAAAAAVAATAPAGEAVAAPAAEQERQRRQLRPQQPQPHQQRPRRRPWLSSS